MTNTTSAISGVSASGAASGRTGRPALTLKGGKLYSEARDEANFAIRAAKDGVKSEQATLKSLDKAIVDATKARDAIAKRHSKTKPESDAKLAKAQAKSFAAELKQADANIKTAVKSRDAQAKAVAKARWRRRTTAWPRSKRRRPLRSRRRRRSRPRTEARFSPSRCRQ
jgi:hypothetical protein